MKKRINQSIPRALILTGAVCGFTVTQRGDLQPAAKCEAIVPDRRERFIAAVDWSVDKNAEFVWPFESMQPAPYGSVRMIVEAMPVVSVSRGREKSSQPLVASRHLRINGRLQKPIRVVRASTNQPEQQEFLVRLDRGRLRLRLMVPAGTMFDQGRAMVRIKLFEV